MKSDIKTVCNVCKKEITSDQKKGGYFPGGSTWKVTGNYNSNPTHRHCHLSYILADNILQ